MEKKGKMVQQHRYANPLTLTGIGKERQGISAGLLPPKVGREIIWLKDPNFFAPIDVHAVMVVDDIVSAIPTYLQQGYTLAIAPFALDRGRGAVIQHAAGVRVCLFDLSHGSKYQPPCSPRKLCASGIT